MRAPFAYRFHARTGFDIGRPPWHQPPGARLTCLLANRPVAMLVRHEIKTLALPPKATIQFDRVSGNETIKYLMPHAKTPPAHPPFLQRLRRHLVSREGEFQHLNQTRVSLQEIDQELKKTLNSKRISGLDALRALAVSLVFIDHFRVLDYFLGVRLELGWFGVMIFFVLSGFLITSMLLKEHSKTGRISLSNFYRRRAYRIFPTFYCCWILTTVVQYLAHRFYWKTAAVSFFYLMDYGRALAPENMQQYLHMWISWSLAVEEKFYLLWPLLLLFLLKRRSTLIRTMVVIILSQWTCRAVLYIPCNVKWAYIYSTFDMRLDALLVGCLLAILVENDRTRLHCCRLLRQQSLSALPPLVLAFMAIAPPSNKALFLASWSLQPLIIAVMLLQAAYWGSKSWVLCSSGAVRMTAHLSYALYLYHPLASQIVYELHMRHLGYYAIALTVIMAAASYRLVELPFMRLRDRNDPARGVADSIETFHQPTASVPGK
jgi:peptidoglycan/LPS O-acetylase OafA/YrhL